MKSSHVERATLPPFPYFRPPWSFLLAISLAPARLPRSNWRGVPASRRPRREFFSPCSFVSRRPCRRGGPRRSRASSDVRERVLSAPLCGPWAEICAASHFSYEGVRGRASQVVHDLYFNIYKYFITTKEKNACYRS